MSGSGRAPPTWSRSTATKVPGGAAAGRAPGAAPDEAERPQATQRVAQPEPAAAAPSPSSGAWSRRVGHSPGPLAEAAAGQGPPAQGIRRGPVRRAADRPRAAPRWLEDDDPRPVAVLGPGGIGKSKLTIAALHHADVAARFGDRPVRPAGGRARRGRRLGRPRPRAGAERATTGRRGHRRPACGPCPPWWCWTTPRRPGRRTWPRPGRRGGVRPPRRAARGAPGGRMRGLELPGAAAWRPLLVEPLARRHSRARPVRGRAARGRALQPRPRPARAPGTARRPAAGDRAGGPSAGRARGRGGAGCLGGERGVPSSAEGEGGRSSSTSLPRWRCRWPAHG